MPKFSIYNYTKKRKHKNESNRPNQCSYSHKKVAFKLAEFFVAGTCIFI